MNLYISDMHFGHKNVIRFDHRPFADVEEMDQYIMTCWNSRVQDDDTVYIVGDICYHSQKGAEWYLRQLKGHKVLILGNHDKAVLNNKAAQHYMEGIESMMYLKDDDKEICLCHFPIAEWDGYFRDTWHIYGHIHNKKADTYEIMKRRPRALNAGCMINNYAPVSFNELIRNNKSFQESN